MPDKVMGCDCTDAHHRALHAEIDRLKGRVEKLGAVVGAIEQDMAQSAVHREWYPESVIRAVDALGVKPKEKEGGDRLETMREILEEKEEGA